MEKIELLSPAGDYDCFIAALNAGADAIYLSGEKYGARAYAKNFSKDELISAIDTAHIYGKKVFLTVNTLIKEDEFNDLFDYMLPYYEAGLDGVIVQDMGVISYLRRVFPDMNVHASTQLAITGIEGIKLLEEQGVTRTVLAREVTLKEINYIKNNSNMELETFVHGALCYSYSGKCLFSSLVGGRSGNRGRCAGSCRQPYNDKYLLSTKDICCLSILPDLIDAGICSLKIEGRMKSPEYVAGVTSMYRKYIDIYYKYCDKFSALEIKEKYFKGKQFENDLNILTKLYTRGGNSLGYYYKHNGKDMITLNDASYKSDKGEIKEEFNSQYIGNLNKIGISGHVYIHEGDKVLLTINDSVTYSGTVALSAEKKPVDEEIVSKQLNKTKDTEFEFIDLQYDISDNAFVRVSDLNELRRGAINKYKEYLLEPYHRIYKGIIQEESEYAKNKTNNDNKNSIKINCEVSNIGQLEEVIKYSQINRVYVPEHLVLNNTNIINKAKDSGIEIYIKFQSVIRYNYLKNNKDTIKKILELTDGILIDSHELLWFVINEIGYDKPIVGDIHIYALNKEAELKYKELGFNTLTVPIELNKKEILKRDIDSEELIMYGYMPMMISAQCINKTANGCDNTNKTIRIVDRKGVSFTAVNDCRICNNIIYNSVPISLHNELDIIDKINPAGLRLVFTIENTKEVASITRKYIDVIFNGHSAKDVFKDMSLSNKFTKGHFSRGVL